MRKRYEPVNLFWWIIAGIFLLLLLIVKQPKAQYREIEQETEVITDVTVAGDSSRAYGFSHGLGDVDINDCIVSKQWGSILLSHQYYKYNIWCMANQLDKAGQHDAAAKLRCQIPTIKKTWPDRSTCESIMDLEYEVIETPELTELKDRVARYDKDDEEDREQLEELQIKVVQLEQQIEQAPAPVLMNDEVEKAARRRANSRQALKGEEE